MQELNETREEQEEARSKQSKSPVPRSLSTPLEIRLYLQCPPACPGQAEKTIFPLPQPWPL